MTRKKYLKDLEQAGQNPPAHIKHLKLHDDDGLKFSYVYQENGVPKEARLILLPTNVDEYPDGNGFLIYEHDQIDNKAILDALDPIRAIINHMSVFPALQEVSGGLHQALTKGRADNPILLVSDEIESPEEIQRDSTDTQDFGEISDFDDSGADSDDNFGFDVPRVSELNLQRKRSSVGTNIASSLDKIKIDLRAVKHAGFKVGVYGSLQEHGIMLCVSIKIAKLGISEEAMQAWRITRSQYLVLLIRFPYGYRELYDIKEQRDLTGTMDMHVGLCDKYKPRYEEALSALKTATVTQDPQKSQPITSNHVRTQGALQPLFIGEPMNSLLQHRFAQIILFRSWGYSWPGAEHCFNLAQGSTEFKIPADIDNFNNLDNQLHSRALPAIVKADSLSTVDVKDASLPLVAMQFVLRHFVRCTEFCLVCHSQLSNSFEALKPYVCSNPLCLYQYLKHGFGPSIEWEIISQPYVIDLLVSLCYAQARAGNLKELPNGVDLMVPLLKEYNYVTQTPAIYGRIVPPAALGVVPGTVTASITPQAVSTEETSKIDESFRGTLLHATNVLRITKDTSNKTSSVKEGDWIAMTSDNFSGIHHHRIKGIIGANIYLSDTIKAPGFPQYAAKEFPQIVITSEVYCYLHDTSLQSLSSQHQQIAINSMLDTLPSVTALRDQLAQQRQEHREPSLKSLSNIPPTARTLLRWIVASNRSCIMQVDTVYKGSAQPPQQVQALEPRVSGMDEWMQFRFAQGAPDKEQRFVDCVKQVTANSDYPTIFGWHGSHLHNWHSIIRTGLNFDITLHGRAFGHGVYMSPHLQTSLGYSHNYSGQTEAFNQWPSSELKVSMVVSLQEVVNSTSQFVSSNPHYVVAQKDWIQTRYLFVKTSIKHSTGPEPREYVQQDPSHLLRGSTTHKPIKIPIEAVSKSRRGPNAHSPSSSKKAKIAEIQTRNVEDDTMSDDTDEEDRELIGLDGEEDGGLDSSVKKTSTMLALTDSIEIGLRKEPNGASTCLSSVRKRKGETLKYWLDPTKTDFVPGSLDASNIKFLPPPSDASPAATKALLKAFNETMKTQETTVQHELGFFLDPDRMENMYQWIVELHSFDSSLPLAKDMKAANIHSVVLEMRFTPDFPFSPPFVRVVKPQFLPFMQGGGGHVTEGGAICMELLTSTGWSVVNSIESVLLQIRLALSETERPARLMLYNSTIRNTCYQMGDAVTAFKRACMKHGWAVPKGVDGLLRST